MEEIMEEEIRIDTRNNLHLSPLILTALDCRSGDIVVVAFGEKCIEIKKKEKQ